VEGLVVRGLRRPIGRLDDAVVTLLDKACFLQHLQGIVEDLRVRGLVGFRKTLTRRSRMQNRSVVTPLDTACFL